MNPTDTTLEKITNEASEITLEDILREFGSEPSAPEPESQSAAAETVPQADPAPISDATVAFTPVGAYETSTETVTPDPRAVKPAKAEPYSDDWEPEYEEPMGEFTPKAPIPFPPKNRLRQLRHKLVEGPERRYQALSEMGLGGLQVSTFVNFLLAVLSVAVTLVYSMGLIDPARLRTVIFCQLLLAMLSALAGCYRLLDGLANLFRGRFTLDTTLFVTFVACIADSLLCLTSQQLSCSCLFCLHIWMAQAAAYQRRSTELMQMDVLRKANDLFAVVKTEDFWNDRPGYVCTEGEPEHFLDHYRKPSAPETALCIYALLSLVAGVGLAVAVYLQQGMNAAIRIFMAAQVIALPVSAFVSISRPTEILQAQLHRRNAVLCGWQGIRATERKTAFPVSYSDLFPTDAIKINGVKFYGSADPGRVVAYTSALLHAEDSYLLTVFDQLPRSRNSTTPAPEAFTPSFGGIKGSIHGCDILVGPVECMRANGIPLTDDCVVPGALYTALDSQLSGVFSVTHSRSKSSAAGLRILCGNRGVRPVLTSCDFLLTPKFIRSRLGVNPKRLAMPDHDIRRELAQKVPEESSTVIALTTKESLAAKALAVTGAKTLKSTLRTGAAIHIAGGLIGLAAVAALALNGGGALLTPVNLLLYTVLWSVPGLLITEFAR